MADCVIFIIHNDRFESMSATVNKGDRPDFFGESIEKFPKYKLWKTIILSLVQQINVSETEDLNERNQKIQSNFYTKDIK